MLLIGWTLDINTLEQYQQNQSSLFFFPFLIDPPLACETVRLLLPLIVSTARLLLLLLSFLNRLLRVLAQRSGFFFFFFSTFVNSLETGLRRVYGPLQRRWDVYVTLGWTGCDLFFFFFFDVWQFRRGLPGGIPPVRLVWLLNHFKEESLPLNYRFN